MLTSMPVASKESESAVCKRTLQIRSKHFRNNLSILAGGENGKNVQAALFLNSASATERQAILDEGNISPVELNAKTMVAMKADMCLPWEKMKTISRFIFFQINLKQIDIIKMLIRCLKICIS